MASVMLLVGENKEYVFKSAQVADAAVENGSAVFLGATVTGQKDVYVAQKPATAILGGTLALVDKEYIRYVGTETIDTVATTANEIVKIVIPKVGQEVVLSNDSVTGTIAVDSFVAAADGTYKMAVTAVEPTSGQYFKIVSIVDKIRIGQRTKDAFRVVRVK